MICCFVIQLWLDFPKYKELKFLLFPKKKRRFQSANPDRLLRVDHRGKNLLSSSICDWSSNYRNTKPDNHLKLGLQSLRSQLHKLPSSIQNECQKRKYDNAKSNINVNDHLNTNKSDYSILLN